MKLLGDIFNIIEIINNKDEYQVDITLNSVSDIYQGHFPGNPITPGVVIIGIAREIIEKTKNLKLVLSAVQSVKYTSVLKPFDNNVIHYTITCSTINESTINAKVQVSDNTATYARMSLTWNII